MDAVFFWGGRGIGMGFPFYPWKVLSADWGFLTVNAGIKKESKEDREDKEQPSWSFLLNVVMLLPKRLNI